MTKQQLKQKNLRAKEDRKAHRAAQIKHAILRAKERYDLDLDKNDIKEIGKIIANNKHIREDFLYLTNPNRRVQIKYKDVIAWVVYSMRTNCVATFLPKDNTRLTF